MVEMLQMKKLQRDATLKCKWDAIKKIIFTCTKKFSSTKTYPARPSKNIVQGKTRFDNECHKTQNGIMSLVVVKDKEIIRSMSMSSKDLFKEREEY